MMAFINGYVVQFASNTGGKAGKGNNKTSTIQVMDGNLLKKQFRYKVGDADSLKSAYSKACQFARNQTL